MSMGIYQPVHPPLHFIRLNSYSQLYGGDVAPKSHQTSSRQYELANLKVLTVRLD
jgi:hypothetical protein